MGELLLGVRAGQASYETVVRDGAALVCTVDGTVCDISATASGEAAITLRSVTLQNTTYQNTGLSKRLLLYLEETPPWKIGYRVRVTGELSLFDMPGNPGQFDARSYYEARNIRYRMSHPQVAVVRARPDRPSELIRSVRDTLLGSLRELFDERDYGLMAAMLAGDRSELEAEVKQTLVYAGVSHVLSVSGLHVAVFAGALMKPADRLLSLVRLRGRACVFWQLWGRAIARALVGCGGLLFYTEFVGCGIPVQRAGLMLALSFLAAAAGRSRDFFNGWGLAASLVLMRYPRMYGQASFLLSFTAAAVIGGLCPLLMKRLRPSGGLWRALLTYGLLQCFLLPLNISFFYEYYLYGFVANLLLLPVFAALPLTALFLSLIYSLWPAAGLLLTVPCRALLSLLLLVCDLIGRLPGNYCLTGAPGPVRLWLYLVILCVCGLLLWRHVRRADERGRAGNLFAGLLLLLCLAAGLVIFSLRTGGELRLCSLSVGQGDCHVLELPDGHAFLVDGGSMSRGCGSKYIVPYLKYRGIRRLDGIFISHGDFDHLSGLKDVLGMRGLRIDGLLPARGGVMTEKLGELLVTARSLGVPTLYLQAGDELLVGKARLRVLYPPEVPVQRDANEASLVLLLEYGDFTGLLTGDLGMEGENRLLEQHLLPKKPVTWLKVGHHGSKNSSGDDFLMALSPQLATISCGRKNRYGHPHEETLARLQESGCLTYRTDEDGAVTLLVESDGTVRAECFRR